MNFGFTQEQELLRAEVRRFLDRTCPLEEVRKLVQTPEGFSRSAFSRLAELGWVGLALPEAQGGAGLGWVDLVLLFEETGRTLFPSPLLATTLAACAIERAGSPEQRARWLPRLASGSTIGTLAFLEGSDRLDPGGIALSGERSGAARVLRGEKHFVLDAEAADLFLLAFREGPGPEEISLALLERGARGLGIQPQLCIDRTVRQGRLELDGVRVGPEALLGAPGGAWPTLAGLLDRGALAVAAECVGAAEAALALAVGYARERVQFGRPIGSFQGVKHPLAQIHADLESTRSLVYYAAWALDRSPEQAPLAISRAKASMSELFPQMAIDVVQLHGAIGITHEHDAHLYLKRAKWARPAFGDSAHHYERSAALRGL
jgi:alkylation response protein AidB-like acyl-CoA dehydrogenase